LGVEVAYFELNEAGNGSAIQQQLASMSGQRTVPNVFVGGKHLGGCDDTTAAAKNGSLQAMLAE
jgi:glutaredoxin 3